jgi:hypothetical protein
MCTGYVFAQRVSQLSHDVPPSEARVKKNRPASASSSAPRESVEALPDKPAEALRSKSSSNVIRETTSRVSQEPSRKQTAESPEQKHATVDWLAVELPSGWERRLHAATHRVSLSFNLYVFKIN